MGDQREYVKLEIDIDRKSFVSETANILLRQLKGSERPQWGTMTPQHMVEHLVFITENTLGHREIPLLTPEEKLPKYKAFLMSDRGFMRNFKFPLLPKDGLPELRYTSIDEAREEFEKINAEMITLVNSRNFETAPHPFYGRMNREETMMFQFKHLMHHLMQFNLVK